MLSASGSVLRRPAPRRSSGTCATPRSRIARAPAPVTVRPATSMRPLEALSVPADDFREFPLAVARHTDDAEDLATAHAERNAVQSDRVLGPARVLTACRDRSTGPGLAASRAGAVSAWPHINSANRRAVTVSSLATSATTAP